MPFQHLSSRPHAKDKHGWTASMTLQEIYVKQVEQGSMDMTQSKSIKWKDQ
jgi:hypothetical protein